MLQERLDKTTLTASRQVILKAIWKLRQVCTESASNDVLDQGMAEG